MSTTHVAVLQLHDREAFERATLRALVAGALAGGLHLALARLGLALPSVPLLLFAVVAAAARGDRTDRALLVLLGAVLPAAAWGLAPGPGWGAALGGAAAGALLVQARHTARGEEGQLGALRPAALHRAAAAGLGLVLTPLGDHVADVLRSWSPVLGVPALLAAGAAGAATALFAALPALAAHVALAPDPVEARAEALLPALPEPLRAPVQRALGRYRQCGESLAALPRGPAREALARALAHLTSEAVEIASAWSGIEAQLAADGADGLAREAARLRADAQATGDAPTRRQLERAAATLDEALLRREALRARRERLLARLHATGALLESARGSLLALRSAEVQGRAAALSALARRFEALARAPADEGEDAQAAADALAAAHEG